MFTVEGGQLSNKDFILRLNEIISEFELIKDNKKILFYNVPAAFDIEVSSFYQGEKLPENKRAIMYIWQLGIFNIVTTGRTWESFLNTLEMVRNVLDLSDEKRLIIYVHNLPYEFQFIRKRLNWDKVFLLDNRKPVQTISQGIEFRCSLKLAGGKSLEKVGEDLQKYKVLKAVGNLDYDIIRTPLTPLTEKELLYCENDIRVLLSYIQEKIEQDGDITKIPLTNTGYVRNYCRKKCYSRWRKYRNIINELTIDGDEYKQLKRAFQGGFTHANAHYVEKILHNVGSHDLTSSYPTVMVLEKLPMTKCELIKDGIGDDELKEILLNNCCLFDIEIFGLMPKIFQEHPISKYKCYICENAIVDNGRIVMAEHIATTITEQDYFIYQEFYTWEEIKITSLRVYHKNYLPKRFVESILHLYANKTKLKKVKGEEVNYMILKNMTNASYGMVVTDPIRDEFDYQNDFYIPKRKNVYEGIEKYNSNIRRFLFYPWGVWITAYARANLFSAIIEMGDDYVYADTDSVKTLNTESHLSYFERYNQSIINKIQKSSDYHGIPIELYKPQRIDGKEEIIGFWDDEGIYQRFKTIGAKRYMFEKLEHEKIEEEGLEVQLTKLNYTLTVAGTNKVKTMAYLETTKDPFNNFDNGLVVPAEKSGRLILTYIDDETEGDIIDCNGVPYHYHELSSVHMEKSDYTFSMSDEFIKYLENIQIMGD